MRLYNVQLQPKIADLTYNTQQIIKYYQQSCQLKANICIFPELAVCGYIPKDLLLEPDFIDQLTQSHEHIIGQTANTYLLLPTILSEAGKLYNSVIIAHNKEIVGIVTKQDLPNYDLFTEKRYFTYQQISSIIEVHGQKIGVIICEDFWTENIAQKLADQGAKLLIVVNASPFDQNKIAIRIKIAQQRFAETKIPIIYCNQVLAHDGVVFDGNSFCLDRQQLQNTAPAFAASTSILSLKNQLFEVENIDAPVNACFKDLHESQTSSAEIYAALVFGLRSYVHDNGFTKVVVGISGGIDSAIVAKIAVDALGKENVIAYFLPSEFTSQASFADAEQLATNLQINLHLIEIQPIVDLTAKNLSLKPGTLAHQNLQARIRGCLLMGVANDTNSLLLTTGNKSELATGYATLYGDMNGAFNPIGDIYKTAIYQLAAYINQITEIIPNNILLKAPSAELAPDQKDADSLPEYEILDQILLDYFEHELTRTLLINKYGADKVKHVLKLVHSSEFKRQQAAPVIKISSKSFTHDRLFPLTYYLPD